MKKTKGQLRSEMSAAFNAYCVDKHAHDQRSAEALEAAELTYAHRDEVYAHAAGYPKKHRGPVPSDALKHAAALVTVLQRSDAKSPFTIRARQLLEDLRTEHERIRGFRNERRREFRPMRPPKHAPSYGPELKALMKEWEDKLHAVKLTRHEARKEVSRAYKAARDAHKATLQKRYETAAEKAATELRHPSA